MGDIKNNIVADDFFAMQKGTFTYPSVCIDTETREELEGLPILMESFEEGSLPLLIKHEGRLVEIGLIQKTPLAVAKLLKFYPLILMCTENYRVSINTVEGLLDELQFEWGD